MPLSCTFGLTACLIFGGVKIPAEDAIRVMDYCDSLRQLPPATFVHNNKSTFGKTVGESIEDIGVILEWPPSGAARKARWLSTCAMFEATYNRPASWENIEKFPQ